MTLTLCLIPLDERPVNTRYPACLAAIAGAQLRLPPPALLGHHRTPADTHALAEWLQENAPHTHAALVAADMFAYGNLIATRLSQDSAARVLARLLPLAALNTTCPVHVFATLTRVPNADDCVEEPPYWARWGTRFHRYSRLAHRDEQGRLLPTEQAEFTQLQATLPPELKADWLTRRLRNHTVTLGLLDMAARAHITSLALTSDDTAPDGLPTRERDGLRAWPPLIGPALAERLWMYPGADEVACALVARQVTQLAGKTPRIFVDYAVPGDERNIAPYEDRPVRETVQGQIAACGGVPVSSVEDSDFILGVVPPVTGRADYRPAYLAQDRLIRTPAYAAFLTRLGAWQDAGHPIALADVAYPNGADPLLMERLFFPDCPLAAGRLAAFGAWNTAGNTLGTVVAQGVCALQIGSDPLRAQAQARFLAHRFLEDYGYQSVVRREARADCEAHYGRRDPDPDDPQEQAHVIGFIETRLTEILGDLQQHGVGAGLTLFPGSVRLPWRRTFEVDFTWA